MPTISLTATNEQVQRIAAAYGVKTAGELKTALIADIKNKVAGFESNQVRLAEYVKVRAAQESAELSERQAFVNAEADIAVS